MRVMSSTLSPAVAALDWARIYFWGIFILFSGAFGRLTISSRRRKVKKIKILYYFIVPWGTQRELVNTPWTHHVLHLFRVQWGTLSLGDLVHFYIISLH